MEDSQIAAALAAQLAERLGAQRFELWFGPQTRICISARGVTIRAASAFMRDCLFKNFAYDIRICWEAFAGRPAEIEFELDESLGQSGQSGESATICAPKKNGANGVIRPPAVAGPAASASDWRPEFGLAGFVVGPSNEYAFRAAELTASGRQQASPLLLCGPTGVGKSHLLRAIQREYRRQHPRSSAIYLSAEQFTTGFVDAIRGSGLPSFRQKCRGAHLLLIDDLQFFAGKKRTIEELQHTVDTLLAEGRQLVLASDRSLAELGALGPELLSRLAGGLTCEIEPPEFATRSGILRRLADEIGIQVGDEILSIVATQVTDGARELRGALHRLHAISLAYNQPVTREMANQALGDLARHGMRAVRLADVEKVVCDMFGVEPARLRSDHKGRALHEPRMLAMWLARKYTRSAWSEIGQFFGRRSHSTVISAHRRVERLISSRAQIGISDRSCGVEEAIRRLEAALRSA